MKCEKAHGWMEPKFHPQIYKKAKTKKEADSQEFIQNLATHDRSSRGGPKFAAMYPVGSPFFKNEREYSEASRKTKPKTNYNNSDRSNDGSSNRDIKECTKSEKFDEEIMVGINMLEDGHLWQNFQHQASTDHPKEETSRAKSLGKPEEYDVSYSKSIKDVLIE